MEITPFSAPPPPITITCGHCKVGDCPIAYQGKSKISEEKSTRHANRQTGMEREFDENRAEFPTVKSGRFFENVLGRTVCGGLLDSNGRTEDGGRDPGQAVTTVGSRFLAFSVIHLPQREKQRKGDATRRLRWSQIGAHSFRCPSAPKGETEKGRHDNIAALVTKRRTYARRALATVSRFFLKRLSTCKNRPTPWPRRSFWQGRWGKGE